MFHDGIEFYNVDYLEQNDEIHGLQLHRFKRKLIDKFDFPRPASFSRGCEMRFDYTHEKIVVYLCAIDEDARVSIFFGEHFSGEVVLEKGVITPVTVEMHERLVNFFNKDLLEKNARYSVDLCRIFFESTAKVSYCGKKLINKRRQKLRTKPRPKQFLAYGSSITHGSTAISNYNSYIQILARKLGMDALSFGMSGACMCEREIADHIAEVEGISFYYLEIGINMRENYTIPQFEERIEYMFEKLQGKKVFATTIYSNWFTHFNDGHVYEIEKKMNEILTIKAEKNGITLFDGTEILENLELLCADLVHPSTHGQIEMANVLYKKLRDSGI